MTSTLTRWIPAHAAGAASVALLLAALAGCSGGTATTDRARAVPISSSPSAPATRLVLRFGDHAVSVTLADNAASRQFAARLPMRVQLRDTWGQAKSARLSHPLTVDGAARTAKPRPGGLYYWPDTAALAIYYDDLGQSVPPPGLIQLGIVDTGLDQIAEGGGQVTARIERAVTSR